MGDDKRNHWNAVYASKKPEEVSWYQLHLQKSVEIIAGMQLLKTASILDVGGGASTLVDDLLDQGFQHLTVVDLSVEALKESKKRLGKLAEKVTWMEADITQTELVPSSFDLWHDRAVFHFLVSEEQRKKYCALAVKSLKPGAHLLIATFNLDGPEKCSGLEIKRYSPDTLKIEFGDEFQFIKSVEERHQTPSGKIQSFIYCHFQRRLNG